MALELGLDMQTSGDAAGKIDQLIGQLEDLTRVLIDQASAQREGTDAAEEATEATEAQSVSLGQLAIGITAAVAAAGLLAAGINKLSVAGIEGERDFVRLDRALAGAGASFGVADAQIQSFLATIQATTRYAGGQMASALATITRLLGEQEVSQQQLVAIGQVSAGVAEQLGISLESASERVVRALEGQSRALFELGVSGETADEVFAALDSRYGDVAQSIDAMELSRARLRNGLDDLARVFGTQINASTNLSTSLATLATIVDVFVAIVDRSNASTAGMRGQLQAILPFTQGFALGVEEGATALDFLIQTMTIASNVIRVALIGFEALSGAARFAASGILSLALAIAEGLVRTVRLGQTAITGLLEALAGLAGVVPGLDGVSSALDRMSARSRASQDGMEDLADALRGMNEEVLARAQDIIPATGQRIVDLAEDMARATRSSADLRREAGDLFRELAGMEPAQFDATFGALFDIAAIEEGAAEAERVEANSLSKREEAVKRSIAELERVRLQALQRTSDVEFSLLDRDAQRRATVERAALEFGVDLEATRTDLIRLAGEERAALREAESEADIARIQERIALLQSFAAASADIERERLREEARIAAERDAMVRQQAQTIARYSTQAGASLGRIFQGADPGREFFSLVLSGLGDVLIGIGTAQIAAGLAQLVPGPLFSPAAGALNIAQGAAAALAGGVLGATVPPPATGGGGGAAALPPAPMDTPRGFGDSGEQRVTTIIDARSGVTSNPVQTAQDIRRLERAGARTGQMPGRGYT